MAARLAHYGIQPSGQIAPLDSLAHLDEPGLEMACLLRDLLAHKRARSPEARVWSAFDGAVYDLLQEQGFTALNRLCALRMAEERNLITQCVGNGLQSLGFELFEYHTDKTNENCPLEVRYQQFLYAFFDELALDLGALFARYSPHGLLFPSPQTLAALLAEINHPDLAPLWAEDETIGWIYQYWNSQEERRAMRDASAAPRNSRELAVRNQFFTPRYVVEFLTDNTLGRIWYEMRQGQSVLKEQCRYLVRRPNEIFLAPGESVAETPVADNISQEELLRQPVYIPHRPLKDPREIRLLDPACGSMHFGLYAFDLFEAIYAEAWDLAERSKAEGVTTPPEFLSFGRLVASFPSKAAFLREVPRLIIEHNIHGIDIDPRAAQIAGLSLWLRAQRTWYRQNVPAAERPAIRRSNIVCAEPMPGEKELLREFVEQTFPMEERPIFQRLLEAVFEKMQLAGEAGSLLKIEEEIQTAISEARTRWKAGPRLTQGLLFGGAGPTTAQDELDLSGVTDELFWDRVEDRIYEALGEYAAQAESTGYSRRLFAEDAAKGFAFIEVCRKRYDAVVMNPPFGEFVSALRDWSKAQFATSYQNILAAFVARGLVKLQYENGFLGAITSRTCFFLAGLTKWREQVLLGESEIQLFADLGHGVMDAAHVEAAAYILRAGQKKRALPRNSAPLFVDLLGTEKKAESLMPKGSLGEWQSIPIAELQKVPGTPFSYWLSSGQRDLFVQNEPFNSGDRVCKQGLATANDNRYLRIWWEVPSEKIHNTWRFYVKGGARAPFHNNVVMVANWARSGAEIKNDLNARGVPRSNVWMLAQTEENYFFKPAITWSRRAKQFSPNILPAGCIFSVRSECAFMSKDSLYDALGLMNAPVFDYLFKALLGESGRPEFIIGTLKKLPWPDLPIETKAQFKSLAVSAANGLRKLSSVDQTTLDFATASHCFAASKNLEETLESFQSDFNRVEAFISEVRDHLGQVAFSAFDLSGADQVLVGGKADSLDDAGVEEDPDDLDEGTLHIGEVGKGVPDYWLGSALGRWDIRYATGDRQPPELTDPFAPLPVCPPGMLQNTAGLPAGSEDVSADYPIQIPWDGILVDDPEHPLDIERRVREVIEIIWTGQNGAPNAAAIESEACDLLEVRSLREYFRKPAGFFADHLKRYSKSRRKAPIYWPLSTPSGGYTIWLYYHRLNDGTLYKVVEQFVDPKQAEVQATFQTLVAKEPRSRAEDRELENAQTLMGELAAFREDLLRLATIWKPNLNDGVVITAAPLWRHFRLSTWQRELRTTWESLERGVYDWAHLAYTMWPPRVTEKCKTDRSLAIAHGLEHLCTIEPPKPKKKRSKAKVEDEEEML